MWIVDFIQTQAKDTCLMLIIEHCNECASQSRTLTPPDIWSCPIWTCIRSNIDTSFPWTCHVSGLWISNIPRYFYFALYSYKIFVPLDPPTVKTMPDKVIKEGATLALTCEVTSANPLPNTYTWTKVGDEGFTQAGPVLTIHNIQRSHTGTYRCTATNTMVPTIGGVQQGSDAKDIAVKVQCRYLLLDMSANMMH